MKGKKYIRRAYIEKKFRFSLSVMMNGKKRRFLSSKTVPNFQKNQDQNWERLDTRLKICLTYLEMKIHAFPKDYYYFVTTLLKKFNVSFTKFEANA